MFIFVNFMRIMYAFRALYEFLCLFIFIYRKIPSNYIDVASPEHSVVDFDPLPN